MTTVNRRDVQMGAALRRIGCLFRLAVTGNPDAPTHFEVQFLRGERVTFYVGEVGWSGEIRGSVYACVSGQWRIILDRVRRRPCDELSFGIRQSLHDILGYDVARH